MRFSTQLFLLLLVLFLILGGAVFYAAYSTIHDTTNLLRENVIDRAQSQSNLILELIAKELQERYTDIQIIANNPIIRSQNLSPEQITQELIKFNEIYKIYLSISVFDLNRVRIADTKGIDIDVQHPLTDYWTNPRITTEFTIQEGDSITLMRKVIFFTIPIKDDNGKTILILVARMPSEEFGATVQAVNLLRAEETALDLMNSEGLLLYSNYNAEGMFTEKISIPAQVKEALDLGKTVSGTRTRAGAEEFFVLTEEKGYRDFKGSGWLLSISTPIQPYLRPVTAIRNRLLIILLPAIIFVLLIGIYFSRRLTKPIKRLTQDIDAITKGNFDVILKPSNTTEIQDLTNSLSRILASLKLAVLKVGMKKEELAVGPSEKKAKKEVKAEKEGTEKEKQTTKKKPKKEEPETKKKAKKE